jgi:hypothetical protein
MRSEIRSRLIPAWLVIAATDGLFASALSVFGYHSTATRLWQGVASTVLGPSAMQGGTRTALIGIAMHIGVALLWTSVFFALYSALPWLRRLVSTPGGVIGVAAIYGPLIWIIMSFGVIQMLTGRAPTIAPRWFVQLFAHIPFVALPIVAMVSRRIGATAPLADASVARGAA